MKPCFVFLLLLVSGCTTLLESTSPIQNQPTYQRTKNSSGETVYRQQHFQPTTTPTHTIQPIFSNEDRYSNTPETHLSPTQTPSNLTSQSETENHNWVGYFEGASTTGHLHLGLHGGYQINDYLQPRIGTSFFFSEKELYGGFDLSIRALLPIGDIKPFVGIGGYLGDTKKCYYLEGQPQTETNYVCDKKFLTAGYTEFGVNYKFLEIFWRNYNINRAGISIPTDQFFGIGIVFQ